MDLPARYEPTGEAALASAWEQLAIYHFDPADPRPIYAVDTPPPTVSGAIHIGHVYSYVQAEAIVRFQRMAGRNVYYPFGFDDNGLPTERFVERSRNIRARDVGRSAFIATCLELSHEVEDRFEQFWKRLGMSVDWRLRYSTIDTASRRIAQESFLALLRSGRIYRAQAPNPWCVECQTAIAQAEIDDLERPTIFFTLLFGHAADPALQLPIATTRPELLPACVALFVHPDDQRFHSLIGSEAVVPLFDRRVPILADPAVDPAKGSGIVMCCTFGDAADVAWWRNHHLPLIDLVARDGRLGAAGGAYAGQTLAMARRQITADLAAAGLLAAQQPATQTVRVHERCGTPLEIRASHQWFVRLTDARADLLAAGRQIIWQPAHMQARYEHWVANLSWDWCISRQRFFGVPFPIWHCPACGAFVTPDPQQLPIDPLSDPAPGACTCGNTDLQPDADVMDTWATSSLSPQIATMRWAAVGGPAAATALQDRLRPMQLRPQAHDIIRTWAFYTIAQEWFHHGRIPWQSVMISGHALDPSGTKLSKSKGNAILDPDALITRYGADAVRYWACSGTLGADQPVVEATFRQGSRLVAKLWSAARLLAAQLDETPWQPAHVPALPPADRALRSWLQRLVARTTAHWEAHEYQPALEAAERFFWSDFCDNYLELVKARLYDRETAGHSAAIATLGHALLTILKLLAPVLPFVTDTIYRQLFAAADGAASIHVAGWPAAEPGWIDESAEATGSALIEIAAAGRRPKPVARRGLGTPVARLTIAATPERQADLAAAIIDLRSITRAVEVRFVAAGSLTTEGIAADLAIACDL